MLGPIGRRWAPLPSVGTELVLIGHPNGIPMKIADAGFVTSTGTLTLTAATSIGATGAGAIDTDVTALTATSGNAGDGGTFGSVTVNTPSVRSADACSTSILSANSNVRANEPKPRST